MVDNIFMDVRASLLKYCKDVRARYPNALPNFDVFDFDSHASVNDMPENDVIGISEYSIANADNHYYVTCMIVICTKADDAQLGRLNPAMSALFSELKPGFSGITVVNAQSGNEIGVLKVMENVTALPVARADNRPIQMIAVEMGSSFLVPP